MAKDPISSALSKGRIAAGEEAFNEAVASLYDYMVKRRDKFSMLGPVTELDLRRAAEVTIEAGLSALELSSENQPQLPRDTIAPIEVADRDPRYRVYIMTIALLAAKTAKAKKKREYRATQIEAIADALDALTFDHGMRKTELVKLFRSLKEDIARRVAWIKSQHATGYSFPKSPELYRDRPSKRESPEAFFKRVYARHVPRGMTQADIRRVDPAFYNVFHVWCTRHEKRLHHFVPAARLPRR